MAKKFPILPSHPERVCWGCDQFCAANDMRCGNGSDRTPHPSELFGEDWLEWGESMQTPSDERGAAQDVALGCTTGTPLVPKSD